MIALLQRVTKAEVTVNGITTGKIGRGLLIFLGICEEDGEEEAEFLVNKISTFRIFNDENKKMNLSIMDINGAILLVSQFTLCADWQKGRRPSFTRAANPHKGKMLYEKFHVLFSQKGIHIETGIFGAMMDVKLTNDGPVTFVLDTNHIH